MGMFNTENSSNYNTNLHPLSWHGVSPWLAEGSKPPGMEVS